MQVETIWKFAVGVVLVGFLSACGANGISTSSDSLVPSLKGSTTRSTSPMPLPTEVADPKTDVGGKRRIPAIVDNIDSIPTGRVSAKDWGHWYDKQVFDFQTKDLGKRSTEIDITIWSAAWESKDKKTFYPEETYYLAGVVNTDTSFDLTGKMITEKETKTLRVVCTSHESCWSKSGPADSPWVKIPYKEAMMNIKYQNFLYLFSDNFPSDAKLWIAKDRAKSNIALKGICNERPSTTKAVFTFKGDETTTKMTKIYDSGEKAVEETRIMRKIPLKQIPAPI